MPTERIQEINNAHVPKYFSGDEFVKPVYLSILRSRCYTKVWKETEGQPVVIRRAKAFAKYLETVPIFIRPGELIVGFYAEDPHAMPNSIEMMDSKIIDNYLKAGYVKADEAEEWQELRDYWNKRNLGALIAPYLTEEDKQLCAPDQRYTEVLPTGYTSRTLPDHDLCLEVGVNRIMETIHKKLERLSQERDVCAGGDKAVDISLRITDLTAMLIAAQAFLGWVARYASLARKMAAEEQDPKRKEELKAIAGICDWVPANPARTFWESVQSHWFSFLAYHVMELLCHGVSLRLDQVFWPWFQRDVVINKTLEREKAIEIIQNLLINVDELGRPLGLGYRRQLQGVNYLATYTIGGVKPEDGSDACNELTMAILDAIDDLRPSHPDFKMRWHPKIDPRIWQRAVEVVRSGLGQPSIKNDTVIIPSLMNHYGFTLEEARSYTIIGCISPAPTINWGRCRRDAWSIRPAKCFELALNNGIDPVRYKGDMERGLGGPSTGDAREFTSFDEFFEAFRKQTEWVLRKTATIKSISEHLNTSYLKRPLASCFFHRSLDAERDIIDIPEKGMPWVNDPGIVDAVDSLIGLKKLVYDDKKYTMDQLLKALEADWEGYEDMRQDFLDAPKFGNDDDYADDVARRAYAMVADEMSKVFDITGTSPMPSGLVVTLMFQLADLTGALPNGRKFGEPLADGGINPQSGFDRNGPMAAVLSASKIDSQKQKANIFNQKFTPGSVEGEGGLRKFQSYIETTMDLGLDMIQFNIIDAATLRAAQAEPEKHSDVVVRVSGYNARFVELHKFVQDAIIERTEYELGR
jgi:benzylsuccinate synthase